jgi:hypothetical protein
MLEADGAYAVDFMTNAFGVEARGKNFASHDSYLEARTLEIEATGATVKSVDEIYQKIQKRLTGIRSRIVSSGIEIQKASKSSGGIMMKAAEKHNLTPLENSYNLKFPVGCIVMANFQLDDAGKILKGDTAKINGAFIETQTREIFYKVTYFLDTDTGCESNEPELFNENQLVFVPGCPIKYSSSRQFENPPFISGKVLLCQAKRPEDNQSPEASSTQLRILNYTIMIFIRGGAREKFEIIENVLSDQLRYIGEEHHANELADSDGNEE